MTLLAFALPCGHSGVHGLVKCELRVTSYKLLLFCELRVSSEKCELLHLKCELRVPKKNFKFSSFAAKKLRFFGQPL